MRAALLVEDLSNIGISVVGVDRSQPTIETAQSPLAQSPAARLEWVSDHRVREYRRRGYNLILRLSVLEFVRDPEVILAHLASLLRLGGLLLVTQIRTAIFAELNGGLPAGEGYAAHSKAFLPGGA